MRAQAFLQKHGISSFSRLPRMTWHFIRTTGRISVIALRAQPLCFVVLIVIQCLQGLVPLTTAWLLKVLLDVVVQSLQGHAPANLLQRLGFLLAAQAVVTVLNQMMTPTSQYFNAELTRRLMLQIRSTIYHKINSLLGLACFENPAFHDTIQVVSANAQMGPLQALTILSTVIQSVITFLSFLGVLITLSPILTGMLMIAVIPQLYTQLKLSRSRVGVALMNGPKERRASYYGQVLSMVSFAKEVRLLNLGEYFLRKFTATTEEIYCAQKRQQRRELFWQMVFALLAGVVASGAFVLVVVQAFSGRLSLGDVALYTSAVASIQAALISLVLALSRANESVLFFNQYTQLLALREPLALNPTPRCVPPLVSGITLRNVSFRYSEQHPWILRHVDLFLPAKQCLALVGLNGAGKTTLVKLLTRLYDPTEGEILWDDIDMRAFEPRTLRERIGTIFQDFARYDLSAQENIGLGNIGRIEDLAAVQQAALKADIHERIEALPDGYQSILSRWLTKKAEGIDLSGGEWQKLALARMFMRESDLLVLDEPTAALDAQAEYMLYLRFKELMQDHTSLLITHRFSTARMADRIAVLEDGRITEYGTHAELLAYEGMYAKLYAMQAESYK